MIRIITARRSHTTGNFHRIEAEKGLSTLVSPTSRSSRPGLCLDSQKKRRYPRVVAQICTPTRSRIVCQDPVCYSRRPAVPKGALPNSFPQLWKKLWKVSDFCDPGLFLTLRGSGGDFIFVLFHKFSCFFTPVWVKRRCHVSRLITAVQHRGQA